MKLYLLAIIFCLSSFSQEWAIEKIMSKPDIWGERVSQFIFTFDDESILYKHQKKNFKFNISNKNSAKLDSFFTNLRFIKHDEDQFIYKKDKSYYLFENDLGNKRLIYKSDNNETVRFVKSLSRTFVFRNNELLALSNNNHRRYKFDSNRSIRFRAISNNAENAVFSETELERERTLYFPDYMKVQTDPGREKRRLRKYKLIKLDINTLKEKTIFTQKEGGFISQIKISEDSRYLCFINHPIDRKTLEFYIYDLHREKLTLVYNARSSKWLTGSYRKVEFSKDSKKLLFVALKSSYERLFVYDIKQNKNRLLTKQNAEITFAEWKNSDEIIFISNENSPLERDIYKYKLSTKKSELIHKSGGYIRRPKLSPKGNYLAYQFSELAKPDELYLYDLNTRTQIKISNTIPKSFKQRNIIKPDIIRTKSSDGKFDIYANFYHKDNEKKPLIVFVHGAGILQNVLNGWTPAYHREFFFHQFLMQEGYHVLDVDYRGSKGYSHRFATDVHSHLGKKELEDIVSFIQKLKKDKLIEPEKIGIYGGSYGGFMTSYALAFEPDLFKAGAALRSVFTWEHYYYTNEWYTRARLGKFEEKKDWYIRSSPLYHVDKIKSPLLILHGMMDNNVPFQDAVKMTQKMIEKGKHFDLMIYPEEKHSFKNPVAWIDEYKRIFNYFKKHLK